jgi:DNA-binding NtrC family response regulator
MSEKSILVVDDEPIVRESIRDWLRDAGYKVITAETGEEAIKLLGKHEISILVIDVRLPGRTGISVLKDVKAQKPEIKSIVITAYPSEELSEEAKKQGAVDYLVKPINPDDLEKLIKETLTQM